MMMCSSTGAVCVATAWMARAITAEALCAGVMTDTSPCSLVLQDDAGCGRSSVSPSFGGSRSRLSASFIAPSRPDELHAEPGTIALCTQSGKGRAIAEHGSQGKWIYE